jgi:hypothetical protein
MFIAIHTYSEQVGPDSYAQMQRFRSLTGFETIAEVMGWVKAHPCSTSIRVEIVVDSTSRKEN